MNKSHYTFKVSGYGDFPSAALKASESWPLDGDNGLKIYKESFCYTRERTIALTSPRKPMDSIWRNHGWRITSISGGIPAEDYNLYHTWPA